MKDPDVGGTFVLSQITFKIRGSQNQVSASPVALEDASYGDKVKLGEDATLYCGAYGYVSKNESYNRIFHQQFCRIISLELKKYYALV